MDRVHLRERAANGNAADAEDDVPLPLLSSASAQRLYLRLRAANDMQLADDLNDPNVTQVVTEFISQRGIVYADADDGDDAALAAPDAPAPDNDDGSALLEMQVRETRDNLTLWVKNATEMLTKLSSQVSRGVRGGAHTTANAVDAVDAKKTEQLEQKLKAVEQELAQARSELDLLKRQQAFDQTEIKKFKEERRSLIEREKAAQDAKQEAIAYMNKYLETETARFKAAFDAAKEEAKRFKETCSHLERRQQALDSEHNALLVEHKTLTTKYNALVSDLEAEKSKCTNYLGQMIHLGARTHMLESELAKARNAQSNVHAQLEDFVRTLNIVPSLPAPPGAAGPSSHNPGIPGTIPTPSLPQPQS